MSTDPTPRTGQPIGVVDDPHAQLSAALVLSLALWLPFGLASVHGQLTVLDAGLRYLVAFVGCRVAIGGITHLLRSYRHLATAEVVDEAEVEGLSSPGG